jgi:hypothetical protein
MNNTGIGLRMTSSRIHQEPRKHTPCPQSYDVSLNGGFHLTDRQKYQYKLLSLRYANWQKRDIEHSRKNAFEPKMKGVEFPISQIAEGYE